jgi:magnesium transporter
MNREELVFTLKTLASAPDATGMGPALATARAQDIAEILDGFALADIHAIVEKLPGETRAEVFIELSEDVQKELARSLPQDIIRDLFDKLPGDEQADLFKQLSADVRTDMLPILSPSDQESVITLASYPEGTVGSLTSSEFLKLSATDTVQSALEEVRRVASDTESIYVGYVLDPSGVLTGTVSLRDLVTADPATTVATLQTGDPLVVNATSPVIDAIDVIRRYDLIAVPVLDDRGTMMGVVTVDDAMDVEREISQRQLTSFGASGLAGQDLDIKRSRFRTIIGVRGLWLAVLTFFGILTSTFVAAQEELLEAAIILAAFIAPIVDMGGNTGSQSATLVIRALALGDYRVKWKDIANVIRREIPVVLTLAIGVALLEAVLAYFSKGVGGSVLLVVGLAMAANIIIGGILGAVMPFVARKIKTDPAALSAPMITSIMDFVGVLVYFGLAYLFLSDLLLS